MDIRKYLVRVRLVVKYGKLNIGLIFVFFIKRVVRIFNNCFILNICVMIYIYIYIYERKI